MRAPPEADSSLNACARLHKCINDVHATEFSRDVIEFLRKYLIHDSAQELQIVLNKQIMSDETVSAEPVTKGTLS